MQTRERDDPSDALQHHLDVTKQQVDRLNQVFGQLDMRPRGQHCPGMAGILEEGAHLMEEADSETSVLEAGLIGAAQRVEHYEIAAYGTLCSFARQLGHDEIAQMLEESLDEEKEADRLLTQIAEAHVNASAEAGGAMDSAMDMGDSATDDESARTTRRRSTSGNGRAARGNGRATTSARSGGARKSASTRSTGLTEASARRTSAGGRSARRR